ncbi:XRE family transcriptional regulator [Faecalitalea cylindroides]|uniref:LexA family protein n=1 Tax=Faecalitalea cylindroides TaxID=39483 RepID=UPI002E7A78DC|nr:XRE family transcriptional regulator [Faecalitalea cylindroides]MEE1449664.1 XRE family transcriptional regulator [Faecalitalea cylindroides]
MKLGEIIKKYISEHDISVREFARKSNLSNTYISNIVNGSDKNPSLDVLGKIAKAMGLSSQQLFDCLDGEQAFAINQKAIQRIPLYTSISCGTGLFVDDQVEDYIAIPDKYIKPGRDYFANTVSGDSMIGKGIKEGDVLVFEKTNIIENGEIGAFCVGESEAVCKTFRKLPSGIILLESANEAYQPIEVDLTDECFRVIGKYKFKFSIEQ